ncbi:MAG TPA: KOW domain-containing RNA-binding protein [Candidatus Mediterraneibacter vanvlietii]|nr:KOW domain-containing RNA-binding protein [Candidatus Mediterraneibacter vanvlietii]
MILRPGMLVKSKAGRDKDHVYIIIRIENEYAYLADGDTRPIRRMKRKNSRHLQPILKVMADGPLDDQAVREEIRSYIQED